MKAWHFGNVIMVTNAFPSCKVIPGYVFFFEVEALEGELVSFQAPTCNNAGPSVLAM